MTPKQNALAFRIWQYAEPLGWDCTAAEIADAVRSTPQAVWIVCKAKGWGTRVRSDSRGNGSLRWNGTGINETILAGGVAADIIAAFRASADEALS